MVGLYSPPDGEREPIAAFVAVVAGCSVLVIGVLILVHLRWPEVTYPFITTVGLALDVAGVTLLFVYGMPPRIKIPGLIEPYTLFGTLAEDQSPPSQDALDRSTILVHRNRRRAMFGFILVIEGFILQAIASWLI